MPIDVKQRRSPGWWLNRQFNLLNDRKRRDRLQLLHDYLHGNPPLPQGADNVREMFEAFQRKARTNFASLIVSAVSARMVPTGFRTVVDGDETGDEMARRVWKRAGMTIESADVHDMMLGLSECYVVVGEIDEETGVPLVTAEDPRYMVGEPEPGRPRKLRAALKVLHDSAEEQDRAYLYLPASETKTERSRVFVARRKTNAATWPMPFDPRGWEWDDERGGAQGQELVHSRMPVVRFLNKEGMAEFEAHLDMLDRINHQTLQRLIISVMQAFRQRAVMGLPDTDPDGNEIDYEGLFRMDPAALWQLPPDAKMWESEVADLRQLIEAIKDDVQKLAAATETPMHMLMPSGENQSAEGANAQRETLVFKTEDRIERVKPQWDQVMSLVFEQMGDKQRADLSALESIWAPAERLSLAERADAASKAQDVPWRSKMIYIYRFPPEVVDRMESERAADLLLQAQIAQAAASLNPLQPPQQPGGQALALPPIPDGNSFGDPLADLPAGGDVTPL